MVPMHVRAVIFDMDGVLTDSEPLMSEASVMMFREHGVHVEPEDFHPFIGTGEKQYLGAVAEKYDLKLDLAEAKKRLYEIYLGLAPRKLVRFPGAVELVLRCRRQGWKTGLASSADRVKIEANLHHIGLPPRDWDSMAGAEQVEHKKPAPDIFIAAAQAMDVLPAHCVVIEDSSHGVEAAKAAGMRCIAVTHTFKADQLAGADLIRTRIRDVELQDLFPGKVS
ncbi:MAG: HAD-IA family hydrolase [Verrucomicrobiota bacterium]|nr:HAD-IA family hydrolase [Verrucomicrobiota bacterium]